MNCILYTAYNDRYNRNAIRLEIDGEVMFQMMDGEPEDNNLMRNFNFDPMDIISKAYAAGTKGIGWTYETKEVSWKDF